MSAVLEANEPDARYLAAVQPALVRQFELLATAPGGVPRLRELILALAIRGRLIPRNPIEGTRVTGATADDDGPFELPEGWLWKRLGALQPEFQNGASSRGDAGGQPITVLRLADITDRRVSLADTREVPIRRQDIDKYLLRDGDILITRVNGSADIVGQFNLVEGELHAIYCDHFIRLRVSRDILDPRYLALFGGSEVIRSRISNLFISTAGQKTVNQGHIGSLPIAIPPLSEQARIVARVDELMRLCDALEAKSRLEAEQHARLLGTLLGTLTDSSTPEELAANWQRVADHFDLLLDRPEAVDALEQTVLQLAVRGLLVPQNPSDEPAAFLLNRLHSERARLLREGVIKKDPSVPPVDDEGPFPLPPGWEWARLGNLANFIDYRGKTPTKTATGVPLITAKNVRQGFINRDPREFIAETAFVGWMTRGKPRVGDLLFTTEAPLGNVAAIDIEERFALAQRVICFSLLEREMSSALLIFLLSPWMQSALTGQASGVTAQGIKSARLQLMPIPVPPIAEQRRIASRVGQLRRLCTDLRRRLAGSQAAQSHLAEALVESATP